MTDKPDIAIVGGTGALGKGLAMRLVRAGFRITIGSRDSARAEATAVEIGATGGAENKDAARQGDIVFVTVPFGSQADTLAAIADAVEGKIVVDCTVALKPPKVARVQLPDEGSAGAIAGTVLGDRATVVAGFHNISAEKLQGDATGDDLGDVLIFGDNVEAREKVIGLAEAMGIRGIHGGVLANSAAAEALTSVLIAINKRYKVADGAGIRITGLG
ncbi:MAG: NADPH-dependent F420 reductase [Magnetovibrionaceae bacterium]